jgi:cell division protein FtsZ
MDAIVRSLDSPLLNDNRITGAKGVLLLIVSGETEITIDEIAEINNYIQSESGGNSNIIMGVGEEEGLGDSIRITVVATGFTTAQQDVQIEKEPQKRVHVLTDDNSKGKVIIKKELETVAVVKKDVPEPVTPSMEKKVVHILEDEVEEVENTYVNTVEEEKPEYIVDNDAVEKDIMSIADDEILISDIDNSQTTIEFDFGSIENSASVDANIEEEIVSIESHVDDSLEDFEEEIIRDLPYLKPEINNKSEEISEKQPEKFTDGSIRYNLQDFEDLEDKINDAKPTSTIVEKVEEEELEPELQIHIVKNTVVEPELELKQKVVENKVEEPIATEDLIDPTDVPLSKREQIGKERRERLKKFNHRFKSVNVNSSTIDDLEKQPAYKRAGIDVTSSQSRNGNSRYSLGNNGDDDVVIRPNNSFLHDNVD